MHSDVAYLSHESHWKFLLNRDVVGLEITADVVLARVQRRQIARRLGNNVRAVGSDRVWNQRNTIAQLASGRKGRVSDDVELDLTREGLHLPPPHADRIGRERVSGAYHEARRRTVGKSNVRSKNLLRNVDSTILRIVAHSADLDGVVGNIVEVNPRSFPRRNRIVFP